MNKENNSISVSLLSYLEAVYMLSDGKKDVRITDIAQYLNISKPSVNRAVKALKAAGYVSHERYGDIILTQAGIEYGKKYFSKHMIILNFLIDILHLEPDFAEEETSKIEHSLSDKTVQSMEKLLYNE